MTSPEALRARCEELYQALAVTVARRPAETSKADMIAVLIVAIAAERASEATEIAKAYRLWLPSIIPKAGDWKPPQPFDEWIEARAAAWREEPQKQGGAT